MKNTSKAIINFMYFGMNYPHDFIEQVWKLYPDMMTHLRDKFTSMYRRYTTMTFFMWFMELDDTRKEELTNWVENNYLSFKHYKID